MIVYRITHADYARQLVASGNPARWNSRDIKVIYTSQSLSLACLENMVHRNGRGMHSNFKAMHIEVPDDLYISFLNRKKLPRDWQLFEKMESTQKIGDSWFKSQKSLLLQVPSVIIPEEFNIIINTLHPDFGRIKIRKSSPFNFDMRL